MSRAIPVEANWPLAYLHPPFQLVILHQLVKNDAR